MAGTAAISPTLVNLLDKQPPLRLLFFRLPSTPLRGTSFRRLCVHDTVTNAAYRHFDPCDRLFTAEFFEGHFDQLDLLQCQPFRAKPTSSIRTPQVYCTVDAGDTDLIADTYDQQEGKGHSRTKRWPIVMH